MFNNQNNNENETKKLSSKLNDLIKPFMSAENPLTSPLKLSEYLKNAIVFFDSISKLDLKNETNKKFIKLCFTLWILPDSKKASYLTVLLGFAIVQNKCQEFSRLIDKLRTFAKRLDLNVGKEYSSCLTSFLSEYDNTYYGYHVQTFSAIQDAYDKLQSDQPIEMLFKYVESFNTSFIKAVETFTTDSDVLDSEIMFHNKLLLNRDIIRKVFTNIAEKGELETILSFLDNHLKAIDSWKDHLKKLKNKEPENAAILLGTIKSEDLFFQLIKFKFKAQAVINSPTSAEAKKLSNTDAYQCYSCLDDPITTDTNSFNSKDLLKHQVQSLLYFAFFYTSLAENKWKDAEFYLNKALNDEATVMGNLADKNLIASARGIQAIEEIIDYFSKKECFQLAIKYQNKLKKQLKYTVNQLTSLDEHRDFAEEKKSTQKQLEALESSINENKQNHCNQIKEILEKNSTELGFNITFSDSILQINFEDKRQKSFFCKSLNSFDISYTTVSKTISFSNNQIQQIQIPDLNKTIRQSLKSKQDLDNSQEKSPKKENLNKKEESTLTNIGNVDFFENHLEQPLPKPKKKPKPLSGVSSSSSASSSASAGASAGASSSSSSSLISIKPSEPTITVTWMDKQIIPNDNSSNYLAVFLVSKYFPENSYIGLLPKKTLDEITDKQERNKFQATFLNGKIVDPKGQNGIVFCKNQKYSAKIKVVDAAKHLRIHGHFAEKATVVLHDIESDSDEKSAVNVIIFDKCRTK